MEFVGFLVGLWKWVGVSGGFLAPVACVFWLSIFIVVVMC
jgi:hypothetical protein